MAQVESKNRATSDPAVRRRVLEGIAARGIEAGLPWVPHPEGQLDSLPTTASRGAAPPAHHPPRRRARFLGHPHNAVLFQACNQSDTR